MSVGKMPAVETATERRVRILVVEDELLIRLLISDVLRDASYDVVEAVNGDEALDPAGHFLARFGDLVFGRIRPLPGTKVTAR